MLLAPLDIAIANEATTRPATNSDLVLVIVVSSSLRSTTTGRRTNGVRLMPRARCTEMPPHRGGRNLYDRHTGDERFGQPFPRRCATERRAHDRARPQGPERGSGGSRGAAAALPAEAAALGAWAPAGPRARGH